MAFPPVGLKLLNSTYIVVCIVGVDWGPFVRFGSQLCFQMWLDLDSGGPQPRTATQTGLGLSARNASLSAQAGLVGAGRACRRRLILSVAAAVFSAWAGLVGAGLAVGGFVGWVAATGQLPGHELTEKYGNSILGRVVTLPL